MALCFASSLGVVIPNRSARLCTRRGVSLLRAKAASEDAGAAAIANATRHGASLIEVPTTKAIPIEFVRVSEWCTWLSEQSSITCSWLRSTARAGKSAPRLPILVPSADGDIAMLVAPVHDDISHVWTAAAACAVAPASNCYRVSRDGGLNAGDIDMGWALGTYSFMKYKSKKDGADEVATLVHNSTGIDRDIALSTANAVFLARDIINTPAEHLGPASLASACEALAAKHGASCDVVKGDDLLQNGYPQVHTVGRAADVGREPRVIEMVWNDDAKHTVTLVGKGVCYDTGGLSIKPTSNMVTMKKDMAGAALVLGLATMVMEVGLNVRLRVLIPAVENAVAGASYRPGDVLTARNGVTTVNENSDAEGRLILADCLVAAAEDDPALIIDCATLTGAQRVALGTDIPALFCNDDVVAFELCETSKDVGDLIWRLPLHAPYRKMMDSPLADIKSCAAGPYGGAIHAALYLQEFVDHKPWLHIDFMGYNVAASPGRPEGGEPMGMRALFHYLLRRFGA